MNIRLGILIYILTFLCSIFLLYGYRETSIQITLLFVFLVLGFSLGAYLIYSFKNLEQATNDLDEIDDDCEVVGKFSVKL